jgi:hypothetical protein
LDEGELMAGSPSAKDIGIGEFMLDRAELAEGIGIFGSGYEIGAMLLAEGAKSLGFRVLAIDAYGKFRPLAKASPGNRVFLLGDYALNPLKPEGRDKELYADLFCEALSHSFGIGLQALADVKGVLLEALDRTDGELTLFGLASLFEAQSEAGSQFTAYGVLQPLLSGRSAAPFRGRQTINMGEMLRDVSVVELSDIQSKNLKALAQSLLIVKILDYARENRSRILLIVDAPEIIWPDTGLQRSDAKASFFYLQVPRMLREVGVHLCLCSTSSLWTERRVLSTVGTLIQFRTPNPYSAEAASVLMGRKIDADALRALKTSYAYVLRPRSGEPELCRFLRPTWLLTGVSREELAANNAGGGIPPADPRAQRACRLVEDFYEGAGSAFRILSALQGSDGRPMQDYSVEIGPGEKRLVSKLLRLQYLKTVNSEVAGAKQVLLKTTEKGIRALREYEKGNGGEISI